MKYQQNDRELIESADPTEIAIAVAEVRARIAELVADPDHRIMKVFAVFHGEYDDYNLYGVFSSEEQAAAFLADLNGRVIQGACAGGYSCNGKDPFRITEMGFGEIREITLDVGCIPKTWVSSLEWKAAGQPSV